MRKFWYLLFFVLLITTIAEFGYLFILTFSKKTSPPIQQTPIPSLTSAITPQADFKIIYQKEGDSEGRTTIYEKASYYGGFGRKTIFPWIYAVGLFDGWEPVAGSKDWYLTLSDPFSKKLLEKVRVVFAKDSRLPYAAKTTKVMVENLEKLHQGETDAAEILQSDTGWSKEILEKLIKKGDALAVTFVREKEGSDLALILDDHQLPVALWLILRRNEGKDGINF
jgi:hypothetical protein